MTCAASLKASLPKLSPLLGVTVNALYERQRELVRKGLLQPRPGRGPGSGAAATLESVALIVASILATDNLSDFRDMTDRDIKRLASGVIARLLAGQAIEHTRQTRTAIVVRASITAKTGSRVVRMLGIGGAT